MKAIVSNKYGGPESLELQDVTMPVPKPDQVLIKVHAASVNYGNIVLLRGKPYIARLVFGIRKPKFRIPGGDIAGTVEAVGEKVTQFQVGDEVYGDLSSSGWGAFAEFVAAPEKAIAHKPSNLSFEEAAAVPMAGVTALQAVRDKGKIEKGQKVLIHGASGGVGTFALQISKNFGADVTAVVSSRNVEITYGLGADNVLDYKKERITESGQLYDRIIGINGSESISTYKHILTSNGICVYVGGSISQMYESMLFGPLVSITGKKKFMNFMHQQKQEDLVLLKELIEADSVKPVIDRRYTLDEVPQAIKYFEEGHSRGKVVISIP
ncbi:NAD(P)-dependent alcohol dehydrogenase [Ornithinibacillus californiensis]|uniref:NAD(P)-dependent alcohol dehydrogenase n=1 Tax=Ornithinibacillus californiensis TaxID=161536 RepID=UPI00064D8121|nr:NAD(P)-dependent alcohol dehydrogenase [Ornithinibacillus californiensis]